MSTVSPRLEFTVPASSDAVVASVAGMAENFSRLDKNASIGLDTFTSTSTSQVTTTSETKVVNGNTGLVVPANFLAVGDILRFHAFGQMLTTAGGIAFTYKMYFGGSYILNTGSVTPAAGANPKGWAVHADIVVLSLSSQRVSADLLISAGTSGQSWWGTTTSGGGVHMQGTAAAGVDLTTPIALNVSAQIASVGPTFACNHASIERIAKLDIS